MSSWVDSIQEYYKKTYPHVPPKDHDALKPFYCINCGEFCKNELFGQKVMIKPPILFPNMFDYLLHYPVDAIYGYASVCFKGEVSLP